MAELSVFIGTYTLGSESNGIYRFLLNQETGRLYARTLVATTDNPSFLTLSDDQKTLYCVNEVGDFEGKSSGAVSAFSINPEDDMLTLLSQVSSEGSAPCYLSLLARHVLVANYMSGTVSAMPISKDGSVGHASAVLQHSGTGPDSGRQEGPHAHSITPFPNGIFAVAADLGSDELITYRLTETGSLIREHAITLPAGSGPRHVAFHPNGQTLFVLNELNGSLTVCQYDANSGEIAAVQTLGTLPDEYSGENLCADSHCSVDGRYIYCTNRGHDSIAVFSFDSATQTIERRQISECGGEHPRNFALTPNGKFLLCANQNTHNIVTFAIDPDNGTLSPTDHTADVPMPVCLCIKRRDY